MILIFPFYRAGFKPSSSTTAAEPSNNTNRPSASSLMADYDSTDESGSDKSDSEDKSPVRRAGEDNDEDKARERDQLRHDRQKQRQKEMRMSKMGTEAKAKHLAR